MVAEVVGDDVGVVDVVDVAVVVALVLVVLVGVVVAVAVTDVVGVVVGDDQAHPTKAPCTNASASLERAAAVEGQSPCDPRGTPSKPPGVQMNDSAVCHEISAMAALRPSNTPVSQE